MLSSNISQSPASCHVWAMHKTFIANFSKHAERISEACIETCFSENNLWPGKGCILVLNVGVGP